MSLTTSEMSAADFAAVCGNGNRNDGFGGDIGWLVLILLLAGNGWGGGFGGFGGFNNAALGYDFPWLLNGQNGINNNVSDGFRSAQLSDGLTAIQSGVQNLSTQLCGCCGDMQMAIANGFAGVEQGANARQMANMQTDFGLQNAVNTGFNGVGLQLCQASGENRLANCQTQNIIQNEGSATRFADANNTRDIIDATNRGNQMILDKLCQLELDGVKQNYENRIAGMQNVIDGLSAQVNAADRRVAMGEEVDALYNRLNNCPVPTTPVYGRTPIFQCNNNGCGCGCGGNF